MEYLTRWAVTIPLSVVDTETLAKALLYEVIIKLGRFVCLCEQRSTRAFPSTSRHLHITPHHRSASEFPKDLPEFLRKDLDRYS